MLWTRSSRKSGLRYRGNLPYLTEDQGICLAICSKQEKTMLAIVQLLNTLASALSSTNFHADMVGTWKGYRITQHGKTLAL